MKFAIITHVKHIKKDNHYFCYAPYVREMNVWFKYVDEVIIVAPIIQALPNVLDISYEHPNIKFFWIANVHLLGFRSICNAVLKAPIISWQIYKAMRQADHIHLRCPGNIGLLGCFVQILFPNKPKTAKYAGNWDPKAKQPWSYRLQKWILNNEFLTRNMQVLVYGKWEKQSKNIKPFFTASYPESEKEVIQKKKCLDSSIEFLFVGSLVLGKNPLYVVKLIEVLAKKRFNVVLNLYGEGLERENLENYIKDHQIEDYVVLNGNQNHEILKKAYQNSHFVILPSKSEGWPKAIAEGMFWGCVPIATKVSCIPLMLDYANRGVLLEMDFEKDVIQIENIINNENVFSIKSKLASEWSQQYTIDVFASEIKKMINREAYCKDKNI